ncbi:hypothetical protein FY528_10280 [Hymenobacter lutimineralis]|uniref:Uncharacterized protein n=1 Tax=Hymenobacter lutimineralis TaxID=2606448 RepID=A0A5D6V3J4_9BACT|nr:MULTISPECIES: hypothetical protein [Hymenobacter]QIX60982.1 hypothetical protein HER32_07220 [Hymenobacter sp. BT18]TYZ09618.1 hypothetical protein FY528_10280 [Hymenobacter lutimineralis]
MISTIYTLLVLAILAYFVVMPRRRYHRPPSTDGDDEGGEPLGDGLPDLDLPPGITRPINDWEPEYNRRPRVPVGPREPVLT